jgi:hypothetical protein
MKGHAMYTFIHLTFKYFATLGVASQLLRSVRRLIMVITCAN